MPTSTDPASTSSATTPSWLATAPARPVFGLRRANTTADVVVIGAGIAGLTTAYLLGREGKKVVVLEDGETASGETGRTTAHLANALDDRFTVLEKLFGETGARLAAESHGAAIDQIEKNVAAENIACEFRRLDGSVVAKDYTELLTSGDVSSADEIAPGSGAVLRHGLAKVATYRDPEGQLHECSAICPHLGCVVHWNNLESSWDCPCHGSRFDALGHLLMGPANSDLAKA